MKREAVFLPRVTRACGRVCRSAAPAWIVVTAALFAVAAEPESAVGPLMKLFQSGRLPPERQEAVVEMICNRGNADDLRVVFDRAVDPAQFPLELRVKALRWLGDAVRTRKTVPRGDLSGLGTIIVGDGDPRLREAAIRLASRCKDQGIAPALRSIVADTSFAFDLRRVALEGLVAIGDDASRRLLEQLAANSPEMKLRIPAAAGLVQFDTDKAAELAAVVLRDAPPGEDLSGLIGAFLDRKSGSEKLAAQLGRVQLSKDAAKRCLRYIYSVGRSDESLSNVLGAAAGIQTDAPPPTPQEVAEIVNDVISIGNAARGEAVFRRKDVSCMKCHSVSRAGGQIGPELSAVGGASPVDYIVNSILNPNLAVKEQYVTRVFVTADGNVLTGIVIDRDEVRVRFRDAAGQEISLAIDDIDEEHEGKSLMPQGLTRFLTREELLDLARFVSELGKPGPYAVQQARTLQRWRVMRSPPPELIEQIPHLDHIREHVLAAPASAWEPVYAKVAGVLPLDEVAASLGPAVATGSVNGAIAGAGTVAASGARTGSATESPTGSGDDGPPVLLLQGEIDISAAGSIEMVVETAGEYLVWLDAEPLPSQPKVRIEAMTGRHKITFRVRPDGMRERGLRVEFLVPPDSTANMVVVGGM